MGYDVDMTTTTESVADLEARLKVARAAEADQAKALRDATPVIWRFVVTPDPLRQETIYDDSIVGYRIDGFIWNLEEATAAGHHVTGQGGMTYYFNTATGKIIGSVGGGTMYVSKPWGNVPNPDSHIVTMARISAFIAANPEGGDITEIVEAHRAAVRS